MTENGDHVPKPDTGELSIADKRPGERPARKWHGQQKAVAIGTIVLSLLAIVLCAYWYFANCPRVEPIIVFLALAVAGLGVYWQLRVLPNVQRGHDLNALMHELFKNRNIHKIQYSAVPKSEASLRVLPQFHASAMENCLSGATLDSQTDSDAFNALHDYHDRVRQVNGYLAVQHWHAMKPAAKKAELEHRYAEIVTDMRALAECLDSLIDLLSQEKYQQLHGIGKDTVLFYKGLTVVQKGDSDL